MLYPMQQKIYGQIHDKFLLNLGTGTGKTIISLIYYLNNHLDKNLYILAPSAKVHEGGWARELTNLCYKYHISIPKYNVVSYSSLSKVDFKDGFYILDEAHYIKNPSAKRSKQVLKLIGNNPFILLTATPGSKIEEFVNYFILWGEVKSKTEFYKKYIIQSVNNKFFGRYFMEITGYKNTDNFNAILKSMSTDRLTINDIVELPDIVHKYCDFTVTREYLQTKKDRVYKINENVSVLDSQIKLCSTLRQIANIKDKIEYLKYLADNLEEDNMLIFYNFNSEYDVITQAIKVDYIINGRTKEYPRINDFDKQKGKITLVQISAGGTGIELQYNSTVVYFSPTYSYQDYEQSLGRAYRHGQDKKVLVYKFNTRNSIEANVWQALEKKEDFNEKLWF